MSARVAVLISGRGTNLERVLCEAEEGVLAGLCQVVIVVSNRPEARGLSIAERYGVPTLVAPSANLTTLAYGRALLTALEPWKVSYLVLAGFLRILSAEVVIRYRDRIVNIHPADTARYQGAHGYEWAFQSGLAETAITVHLVDEGLDTGRVLARRSVSLAGAATLDEVVARGLRVEHEMYSEALARLLRGEFDGAAGDG